MSDAALKMSDADISITIQGINFTLKEYDSRTFTNRGSLLIESRFTKDRIPYKREFYVYQSRSEMGFWRFACRDSGTHLFKGEYDYIQQTFIHLELQKFINENLTRVRHYPNRDPVVDHSRIDFSCTDKTMTTLNSETRKLDIDPMDSVKIDCGEKINEEYIKKELMDFNKKLTKKYNIGSINYISDYKYEHIYEKEIIKLKLVGKIFRVELINKIGGRNLFLYVLFYNTRFCNDEDSKRYEKNKLIPIFFTYSNRITHLGIYEDYIKSGVFICKILEYKSQCLVPGECTEEYSYVGDRYDDLSFLQRILSSIISTISVRPDIVGGKLVEIPDFAGPSRYIKSGKTVGYIWRNKYLKYKQKYLELKKQLNL